MSILWYVFTNICYSKHYLYISCVGNLDGFVLLMHYFCTSCIANFNGFVHHLCTSCIININGSIHYLYTSYITNLNLDLFPNALFLHLMSINLDITNFMGHDLTIIVVQNLFFIGSYGIDMDVIHLLVLFEHQCHVHCLYTNVICMFVLFRHNC